MKKVVALLVLLTSCLLGLNTQAQAFAGEMVPLKGSLAGKIVSLVFEGSTAHVVFVGTGNATELGQYSATYPHQVDLTTGIEEGDMVLVAANGDEIHAHVVGPSWPTDQPGIIQADTVATITGGTGRFADATGAVRMQGLVNLNTRNVTITLEAKLE